MRTIKLNGLIRATIRDRLIKHALGERKAALAKAKSTFAEQVYYAVYPPAVRKAMKALPAGFLSEDGDLRVAFGGRYHHITLSPNRPVAHCHRRSAAANFSEQDRLTQEFNKLQRAEAEIAEEEKRLIATIDGVTESVTTLQKLLEIWPEVEPFAKDFIAPPSRTAVIVPIKQLNKTLGLPPG